MVIDQRFLRRFKDPIRVPRISNRIPRIREIGSLQIHTWYLTFALKKTVIDTTICVALVSFRYPFIPNSLFPSMLPRTGWVGGPKLTLLSDAGNPIVTPKSVLRVRISSCNDRASLPGVMFLKFI